VKPGSWKLSIHVRALTKSIGKPNALYHQLEGGQNYFKKACLRTGKTNLQREIIILGSRDKVSSIEYYIN
jgi:hypothetical protein